MKCAIDYNYYEKEITIYKVYSDGSMRAICRIYEDRNFLHLDVTGDNWKYLSELTRHYPIFNHDMAGISLNTLYNELVSVWKKGAQLPSLFPFAIFFNLLKLFFNKLKK